MDVTISAKNISSQEILNPHFKLSYVLFKYSNMMGVNLVSTKQWEDASWIEKVHRFLEGCILCLELNNNLVCPSHFILQTLSVPIAS